MSNDMVRMATLSLGAANPLTLDLAVSGFRTFVQAAIPNLSYLDYAIEDPIGGREACRGVYNSGTNSITRTTIASSNGGSPIVLSGAAQVFPTYLHDNNRGVVTPFEKGAKGDGVADDTAAVLRAIATGKHVDLCGGSYLVGSTMTLAAFQRMYNGNIYKTFNGDQMDMSAQQCSLTKVILDGLGHTGRGVIVGGDGTVALHRQLMERTFITNNVGKALEFTVPHAGGIFGAHDCSFACTVSTDYPIGLPVDTSGFFAGRWFLNTQQGGNALIDLNGGIGTRLLGGNTATGILWTSSTQYVYISNYRLAGIYTVKGSATTIRGSQISGPLNVEGNQQTIVDNTMQGGSIVLASGLTNSNIHSNDAVVTDNSGSRTNRIWGMSASFTPEWKSTGTQPAVGNGTIIGRGSREGNHVKLQVKLTLGSTSTVGTAAYFIRIPAPWNLTAPSIDAIGTAVFTDASTGNFYRGIAFMFAGTADIYLIAADGSSSFWGAAFPVVPANGDIINVDLDFQHGA